MTRAIIVKVDVESESDLAMMVEEFESALAAFPIVEISPWAAPATLGPTSPTAPGLSFPGNPNTNTQTT